MKLRFPKHFGSYRVAGIYLVLGVVYIIVSDWIVLGGGRLGWTPRVDTLKGIFFVILSAGLIGILTRAELMRAERAAKMAAQSQNLRTVGLFASSIAHDFNNLLVVIIGNAETLQDLLHDRPEARARVEQVLRAGESGAELVARLLAFARQRPAAPRELDVAEWLRQIEGLAAKAIAPHAQLQVTTSAGRMMIFVEVAMLDGALMNLILNARDASPAGSVIRVTADRVAVSGAEATEAGLAPGPYVRISVRDDGCGMSPEVAARAFDAFFSTKDSAQGTGLGLTSVRTFAENAGGRVRFVTAPGSGTTVSILIPELLS
ncbi:MAG: hypothetical protein KF887_11680 [Paracoccaceae bacterium]|nr:MAG: hypothetical protein KF887_11680 [Paracoccaceae bacterium]